MTSPRHATEVTHSNVLDAPARIVWAQLLASTGALPGGTADALCAEPLRPDLTQTFVRPPGGVWMRQHLAAADDVRMTLSLEMVDAINLPWSRHVATWRVEQIGWHGSRVTASFVVTPTDDAGVVRGMLLALFVLSMRKLAERVRTAAAVAVADSASEAEPAPVPPESFEIELARS
jgi:hypothetical protein